MSKMELKDLTLQSLGHRVRLEQPAQGQEAASEVVGTLTAVTHMWSGVGAQHHSSFDVEALGQTLTFLKPGTTVIDFLDDVN